MIEQKTVVVDSYTREFDEQCNKLLAEGWRRVGLPTFQFIRPTVHERGHICYYQTFQKKVDE